MRLTVHLSNLRAARIHAIYLRSDLSILPNSDNRPLCPLPERSPDHLLPGVCSFIEYQVLSHFKQILQIYLTHRLTCHHVWHRFDQELSRVVSGSPELIGLRLMHTRPWGTGEGVMVQPDWDHLGESLKFIIRVGEQGGMVTQVIMGRVEGSRVIEMGQGAEGLRKVQKLERAVNGWF